ncbi:hypothetical protein [Methylococcus sp. Mc7]|uniref:hypothetical protein n=1 Tax=Methylococcus sp. Mc7 TaxID=2860258 RepID=UPI001C529461|nr:hypothetical protein [Methylococcus sp. Mc7]QXP83016.1 hypothetical protein KW115_12505 [Methylococcus sp. Mc7]
MADTFTPQPTKCPECGAEFYRDAAWKRICLPCYLAKKRARNPNARGDICEALYAERARRRKAERDLGAAQTRVLLLEVELHNARRQTGIEPQMLKRLIQLCHPDRHGGSRAAQTATDWLLRQRDREPCHS